MSARARRLALCGVAVAACGRIDFANTLDATEHDTIDAPLVSGPISHVQVFVSEQSNAVGQSHTFSARAVAGGDLVLLHAYCRTTTTPPGQPYVMTSVAVSALPP